MGAVSQLCQGGYEISSSLYGSVGRGHVGVHSNLRGICFDVKTRYDNQSIGSSTCLMAHDSSSSSDILLSCCLFMNGILR